ncbi:DUF4097 family beta strand repeat-containing protein [Limosilactobacillus sp.]|jgi:hypothetical protein|uniref:DUF4097 family beta strand repeat-containing protein n=1 Tax=Limosilactobacillus sp. TaxID=2773925 RepID=UPI0025BC9E5D|nr:DUF4097 family beta strand repeat-containing protein [Limosilactobacillus sp.]MCH3922127.1 DUF4097 domain-containing protein [Limosilactobacillus sp.]MCH3928898.1 DUF4097 domain-containing protein [Limosilactobacillus sp.]
MKKMFKFGWLVLIVGLVALAIGYFNHGAQNVTFENGRPVVQRQASWNLTSKHFKRVDLDVDSANVTIKHGNKFKVSYRGLDRNKPTVTVKNKTLRVRQSGTRSYNGSVFSVNGISDHLTITLPYDAQIKGGRIALNSGELAVNGVDLTHVKLTNESGDVDLSDLTLNGGQTNLSSGEFDAHSLTITGHYAVQNDSGDNEAHAISADGYRLKSDSGDNEVNGQDKDDQSVVEENMNAANTLELITTSGDNEYTD